MLKLRRKPSPVCSRQGMVSPQFQNSHFCGCFALMPMQSRLIQQALRGHLLDWAYRNRKCEVISSRTRTVVWACGVGRLDMSQWLVRGHIASYLCLRLDLYLGFKSGNVICTHTVQHVYLGFTGGNVICTHTVQDLYLGFTSRNAISTHTVQICTSDLQAGM